MSQSSGPPPRLFRRKKEAQRGLTYTMMLCGPDGTGKTTFANNLLESNIFPHHYNVQFDSPSPQEMSPRVKITSPTKVMTFNSKNGIPSFMAAFDPSLAHLESGITITSTSVEISSDRDIDEEIIYFNLVTTHGIGENLDDSLCFEEVAGYLEQQFDTVLAEETRIKRNPRFEDTRVHVAVYFIEPTGHGLRQVDAELMKTLSRYTNVLPVISRADSFSKEELATFKRNIMQDIENYNVPIYKFEVDPEEDDLETIEENQALAALQPFAIVCSDVKDSEGKYVREYPWGTIETNDDKISNLRLLKNVLFGSHLQEFKDTTQNFLYENYRAEKLSSVASSGIGVDGDSSSKRASAAPSLSNFASLINTGQFKSSQTLALANGTPSTPEKNNSKDEEESPIKRMSRSLKQENEEIIRNIKMESPKLNAPDLSEKSKLRTISETVPYVLRHERIISRQQKLEELEAQSARELQKHIQELEKKAQELKLRERLLRKQALQGSSTSLASSSAPATQLHAQIKKEDTYTDLASIASGRT